MREFFMLLLCASLSSCSTCRFRSSESIKAELISKTPIGISRQVAEPKIRKLIPKTQNEKHSIDRKFNSNTAEIGPFIICGYITGWIHSEGYMATWKFDENNKLEKIQMEKWTDSL